MIVRSYTASSMEDALEKVRHDLGTQALIIETRAVREPGLLGKRMGYEVVAAGDPKAITEPPATSVTQKLERDVLTTLGKRAAEDASLSDQASALRQVEEEGNLAAQADDDLSKELYSIRRQLSRLAQGQSTPTQNLGDELLEYFENCELPTDLIAELDEVVGKAGTRLPAEHRQAFCQRYLARDLLCQGAVDWNSKRHMLFVGPTGVGKTTTIAKIAGDLVLQQNRRVALITLDTYRVGASEQLRTYADLLDIPCAIARSPAELKQLTQDYADYDNILIDTAGRRPSDSARLQELRGYLTAVPQITVMLTIAATCGRAEFAHIVERFSVLPIECTTITKVDECVAPGRLLGCLRRHRLPLHYYTDGQEVPQDFAMVDPKHFVDYLFTSLSHTAAA